MTTAGTGMPGLLLETNGVMDIFTIIWSKPAREKMLAKVIGTGMHYTIKIRQERNQSIA